MSLRVSRRFALLAPALLGGLLWMGLPSPADAGGWKRGHDKHWKHHGHHRKHEKHYYKHHSKHHYGHGGYAWYGGHRRYHHGGHRGYYHGGYYPAPVAVYLDGACGHTYESWDHFSHHVHHHHGVAFVDLPGLLVETSFGFAFHR